jgi:Skp family chaperone for outer membrane proteins
MIRRGVLAAIVWLAAGLAGPLAAQTTAPSPAPAPALELPPPILTIDGERLFEATAFGRRVSSEIEAAARALAAENREIEARLIAEERDLTERRPGLTPEEFRPLADAFDEKVQRLRTEQDQKQRAVEALRDQSRQDFVGKIGPVLSAIVRERGALVILDRRSVFLSADSIDITSDAIARIDAAIGDGAASGTDAPQ